MINVNSNSPAGVETLTLEKFHKNRIAVKTKYTTHQHISFMFWGCQIFFLLEYLVQHIICQVMKTFHNSDADKILISVEKQSEGEQ